MNIPVRPGGSPVWTTARLLLVLLGLGLLSGCASRPTYHAHRGTSAPSPGRYYPPPGPASDPWGPYVQDAASRFGIPERWIREVMRQESGGQAQARSWVGAMGLMQVMPDTYEGLRERYALGDDPYDPRNNILAGAAYIKEMYDRYGSPGFLAAYNAGPNRLDQYLSGSNSLPSETVNYLASIAPRLGSSPAMSGPLAAYAMGGSGPRVVQVAAAEDTTLQAGSVPYLSTLTPSADCDPDAAFDPAQPCRPLPQPAVVVADSTPPAPAVPCDPDAAYVPGRRCLPASQPAPQVVAEEIPPPPQPPPQQQQFASRSAIYAAPPPRSVFSLQSASAAELPRPAGGGWAIQVGAFANPGQARSVVATARGAAPELLRSAQVQLPTTTPFGGAVLYRARLTDLSVGAATTACAKLAQRQLPCMVIPPGQGS